MYILNHFNLSILIIYECIDILMLNMIYFIVKFTSEVWKATGYYPPQSNSGTGNPADSIVSTSTIPRVFLWR